MTAEYRKKNKLPPSERGDAPEGQGGVFRASRWYRSADGSSAPLGRETTPTTENNTPNGGHADRLRWKGWLFHVVDVVSRISGAAPAPSRAPKPPPDGAARNTPPAPPPPPLGGGRMLPMVPVVPMMPMVPMVPMMPMVPIPNGSARGTSQFGAGFRRFGVSGFRSDETTKHARGMENVQMCKQPIPNNQFPAHPGDGDRLPFPIG